MSGLLTLVSGAGDEAHEGYFDHRVSTGSPNHCLTAPSRRFGGFEPADVCPCAQPTAAVITSGKVQRQDIPVLSALVGLIFLSPPLRTSPKIRGRPVGGTTHATPFSVAGSVPRPKSPYARSFGAKSIPLILHFFRCGYFLLRVGATSSEATPRESEPGNSTGSDRGN